VLCGCEAGYEVLAEHGAGSGEHEDKQSLRCRANRRFRRCTPCDTPIMIEGGSHNQMVFNWERGHGGC